jgi:hypothetical protein
MDCKYCETCGAEEGTADGQCALDWGGDHAETTEWSANWPARCLTAEAEVETLERQLIENAVLLGHSVDIIEQQNKLIAYLQARLNVKNLTAPS